MTVFKKSMCVFLLVMTMAFTVAFAEDWPMFHHDLALSGYTPADAPATNAILWTFLTGGSIQSSPSVAGNKVYIGSTDGNLYCLDKYTGALQWSFNAGSTIQSTPAVTGGIVYFLAVDGEFYALDASNGLIVWQKTIGPGPWDWSSPAVHSGNVFVASSTGYLYSLDALTGVQNWSTNIGGTPDSPISIVNGVVYSGTHNFDSSSPTLVAVDEISGIVLWTYDYHLYHSGVVGMVNSNGAAVLDGDGDGNLEVYFGVYNWLGIDDQAVCLDEGTGSEVWTQSINGNSTSTPAVHEGVVYIGSDDWNLYALNASDGSVLWTYTTGGQIWDAPAVSGNGMVCFGSLDHTVYCVDKDTGTLIWSYYTGTSRLYSSPAISDGILFIGNENGNVYAFGSIIEVEIDIKPGSYPNSINTKSKGVIPVAILTTASFDATTVDPSTVCFGSATDETLRDCSEAHGTGHVDDVDSDGDDDLVLHFETQETGIAKGDTEACLNGQTYGGSLIEGCDSVRVVK